MFVRTADAGEIKFHVAARLVGGTFQFEECLGILNAVKL
jgi:hypothetical protein